jgi:hypothetical protein
MATAATRRTSQKVQAWAAIVKHRLGEHRDELATDLDRASCLTGG